MCGITGVKLDLEFTEIKGLLNPSIDRIDPKHGYVRGNMQIISWGANMLKGDSATTEETRAYWEKVKKSPIRERLEKGRKKVRKMKNTRTLLEAGLATIGAVSKGKSKAKIGGAGKIISKGEEISSNEKG